MNRSMFICKVGNTMIPKLSVDKFLARKRVDFRKWKKYSLAELEAIKDKLPVRPPIWKKLKKHQRVCFLIGAITRQFCFWNDTGTGKTLLSLALILYFRKLGLIKRNLVLVPNKINKDEWANDVRKHSPNTKVCILRGSSVEKWAALESTDASIILETYAGFTRMLTHMVEVKKGKRKKTLLKPNLPAIRAMLKLVRGLYMDESIYVIRKKRSGSLQHRLCKKLAKSCNAVFALNGTPFGRDPTDLWGQINIVDEGYTLGETLGLFRAAFFTEKEDYWGRVTYTFKKKLKPLLHELIANVSIRYTANAADLPKRIPIAKEVSLPMDAQDYYDKAKQAVIASRGNFEELRNAFMRMRQISSGWVGYNDDELGIRAQYEFPEKPKLESLLSYIEQVQSEYKVVVFHEFTYSGSMIGRELEKMGVGFARLYGKTKDGEAELNRFATDDKCRVFLLQNTSGGFGLDRVKIAKYACYYESPVSPVMRKQTERRVERQYSDHDKVFIVDFTTRGTVDQKILRFHEEGRDLFASIVEGAAKP